MWSRNPADWSPDVPPLGNISESKLLNRRTEINSSYIPFDSIDNLPPSQLNIQTTLAREFLTLNLNEKICGRCCKKFEKDEEPFLEALGKFWHKRCFVCVQCFQILKLDEVFIEDGRAYCKYDYEKLFSVICVKCAKPISEQVIRTNNTCWHPKCFTCEFPYCNSTLTEGYASIYGRMGCRKCAERFKKEIAEKTLCAQCLLIIVDNKPLMYNDRPYHPYHFNCATCGIELDAKGREYFNNSTSERNTYCQKCYIQLDLKICAACRRVIENQRAVFAFEKYWHPEHLACRKCDKAFNGQPFHELNGFPYCLNCYHHLAGKICFICTKPIPGMAFKTCNKFYCLDHFACTLCDKNIDLKSKFHAMDEKPICKKCYPKLPSDFCKRMKNSIKWPK